MMRDSRDLVFWFNCELYGLWMLWTGLSIYNLVHFLIIIFEYNSLTEENLEIHDSFRRRH